MRIFRFTAIIVTCSLLVSACNERNRLEDKQSHSDFFSIPVEKGEAAIITGLVKNRDVYPHVRSITLDIPDFRGYETTYTSPIEEDGSFRFEIFPISTREISLKPLSDIIVVHPGDSIFIAKDFKNIGAVSFTGDAAELNSNIYKFLNENYLGRYTTSKDNPDPDGYRQYCNNYKNEAFAKLKDFIDRNDPPQEFIDWAKTTINFDYYSVLLDYLMYRKLTGEKLESEYYDFIDDINTEFGNSITTSRHFRLISDYYNDYLGPALNTRYKTSIARDHRRDSLFIEGIGSSSKNSILDQFLISHFFNGLLRTNSLDLFEENSSAIIRNVKEPVLLHTLMERYHYVKDYITNPEPLSDAMLGETEITANPDGLFFGNGIRKNLLNRLIENKRGKVLYVDFWANWCPPCIPELEASKRMMESLEGENIEFIFICLSDSVKSKEHIKQIGLAGSHYYLTKDESIFYQNKFGFQSIPHYILTDSSGVIVDFGSYLRPSNPVTLERIKKLLI